MGLISVLLFPYLITNWCPEVTFIAASYYNQRLRVTNHVENNFSQVQAQWKKNISLNESQPTNSIVPLSVEDSRFFQLPSWTRIVEALGYKNSFWECIGEGWGKTIIGSVICLIGIYIGFEGDRFKIFLKDTGKLLSWVVIGQLTLVASLIFVNFINYQLDEMFAQGKYQQVLSASHSLTYLYPSLKGDIDFIERMAKAEFYQGNPNTFLKLLELGLEQYRQKNFSEAEYYFRRFLAQKPDYFLVKEYLVTSLLNQGVVYFNNNQPGAAADLFEESLHIFPNHLEALYNLMLARTFNGEYSEAALLAEQIIEIQKYFQLPDIALLGQAYVHRTWASYHEGNLEQAWKEYRKSVDKGAWK